MAIKQKAISNKLKGFMATKSAQEIKRALKCLIPNSTSTKFLNIDA